MKVAVGSDHAGYRLKEFVKDWLQSKGYEVVDVGTDSEERVDYPEFAKKVASLVSKGEVDRGVLVCGSGIGMSLVANKFKGVRAALCHNIYAAKYSRLHNDSNVLCLGGRVTAEDLTREILETWFSTEFEEGRHLRRLRQIFRIEEENFK